jgi:hypothetical protein
LHYLHNIELFKQSELGQQIWECTVFLQIWREDWKAMVTFPQPLFIQVDGGPENANTTFFAIIELLVARRIIKNKIYLTRLTVGHTHEDTDAVFALIWDTIKCTHALTPQQYRNMILK